MLANAGRTKVVALAADGQDQGVIVETPLRRYLAALLVDARREPNLSAGSIEPNHFPDAVPEVVPVRLRQEIQLVHALIQASRRELVQQRLPQMRAGLVDKRDVRQLVPAELVTKRGSEFEAGGTATDDDNVMKIGSRTGHCSYLRSLRRQQR